MAGEDSLSKIATFIQEGKALRCLMKGSRPEEPVLPDIFTWISHELFDDIENKPIALRHAVKEHIFTSRKDITEVLLNLFTGSGPNANKQEDLQKQVLDPNYDNANSAIYFYCLATFCDIDIYVVTSEGGDKCKWNEYKSLKLLNIKQEIKYRDKTHTFDVSMNRKPGFLMTYMHVDLNGPHMYIIRPTSSARPQRPECKGLVELAARHLKCTPLDQIAMPESLIDDVQKHVNRLPPCNKRIRYWAEEYCIATDCWDIYETTIEVPNEDSWRRLTAPRSDETLRLKLIKHLSDCSKEQVLIFCKVLLRRFEFVTLTILSDRFDSFDNPFKHKYAVLNKFETELEKFNKAISFGALPSELQERKGKVNNAVIGTSVSGIVGGVLGVVGLALIPVTFGVSLGLTIAGGVIGASSGIVQGGFRVHEAVMQNQSTAVIKENMEKIRSDFEQALTDFPKEFNLDAIGNKGPDSPGLNIRGSMSVGSILRSVHSAIGIGLAAARVGTSVATAAAAILAPVSLVVDGGFMAEAIYSKTTGSYTEAGRKLECLRAFQTVVIATYMGNADFGTKIVERTMQND
ncbi:uncharacterized protein LOC127836478 [Dreissena polymorpha]|uniref:Uncharacterized protein n=1 Tax=Dreissena polymorpha TaxID=45954 RepID=A0A9D4GDU8_DREPO|nr:uncharacterized protein LOC127836478 [Dreissena polymorpha]KAH3813165.1 hypothetical protein DPMN_141617 [Dreissena polymorpha]